MGPLGPASRTNRLCLRPGLRPNRRFSPDLELVAVVLLGLTLRLLAWWQSGPTLPAGDEWDYVARALRLAQGESLVHEAARAPGVIAFYAALFRLFQPGLGLARLGNALISSATLVPIYFLARSLAGRRAALLAAAAAAFYPTLVAFSHYLWPATLYIFWLCVALSLLAVERERSTPLHCALAGVALGLSALTKESGIAFAPLAALWLLGCDRRRPRLGLLRAAALSAGFAITLLPWTTHINGSDRPFVLVTRTAYMNLYIGNSGQSEGLAMARYEHLGAGPLESEARAREVALRHIAERLPGWPFEKLAAQLPRFFTPTNFALRRLLTPPGDEGHWGYRFRWSAANRRPLRLMAAALSVSAYLLLAPAGLAGLLLSRNGRVASLCGLFVVSQIGACVVTFAISRFRLPSMVPLIVGAASLVTLGPRDWAFASRPRRALALGVVIATLGLTALDYTSVLGPTGR